MTDAVCTDAPKTLEVSDDPTTHAGVGVLSEHARLAADTGAIDDQGADTIAAHCARTALWGQS